MAANQTTALLELVDEPTRRQLARDVETGYLRWSPDPEVAGVAALRTAEGRVALVYYPAAAGEPYGDFEMADWYAERVTG